LTRESSFRTFDVFALFHGVIMRLYLGLFIILSLSSGALIYYNCAKKSGDKTQVEQNEPSSVTPPAPVHQPQTKNETDKPYDASKDLYHLMAFFCLAQRASAALRADSERSLALWLATRACPPLRPRATAAGFFAVMP
jgi:hypothetical protein